MSHQFYLDFGWCHEISLYVSHREDISSLLLESIRPPLISHGNMKATLNPLAFHSSLKQLLLSQETTFRSILGKNSSSIHDDYSSSRSTKLS